MGCGSSVAQELPATKSSQDVPKIKNSPKPTLMRADKFLSREEARERRQQTIKEKQLQSQNNAQAISAQALIDQERLSTSTKRSLRSYASSSTTTPLKSGDNSKLFDAQNPFSTANEKNLATHSEDPAVSLSPSKQTAKENSVPPGVVVEENAAIISPERTELTVSQQLALGEGDNKTLKLSENNLEEKPGSLEEKREVATALPEKFSEDNSLIRDGDSEIMKGENVRNETREKSEGLPEEIETGPMGITGDAESRGNGGVCDGEHGRNGYGAEEILEPNNSKEKDGVGFNDTVTVEESSELQGQRSSDENGGVSEVDTTSSQAARAESKGPQDEDEGTVDHHVADDTEVVKISYRVEEDGFNDASDGSDEGVADLGEIGEENEVEVPPTAS